MNLISLPYYTINASVVATGPTIESNCCDFLKLNVYFQQESDFTPRLFTALSQLKRDFIITLSASVFENKTDEQLFEKIYLALSLSACSKRKTIIPIVSGDIFKQNDIRIRLKKYLEEQGCTGVDCPVFNCTVTEPQIADDYCFTFVNEQGVFSINDIFSNNRVSVVILSLTDNNKGWAALNILQNKILANQALSDVDTVKFYVERDEFEMEIELWKNRALLYQDFLALSKKVQEKEHYDVIDWYQKEYEILPLWYKRFGHILKVLLGKRTFKSLYRDDVKKYKD